MEQLVKTILDDLRTLEDFSFIDKTPPELVTEWGIQFGRKRRDISKRVIRMNGDAISEFHAEIERQLKG